MDNEKKWTITNGYLNHFEKSLTVMNISNFDEILCNSRKHLDTIHIIGYYVIKNNIVFGIIKDDDSTYFMISNNFYDIKIQNVNFVIRNINDTTREFIASAEQMELVNLTYERQIVFDNWSTEDNLDFFAWLTNLHDSGRLNCILQDI